VLDIVLNQKDAEKLSIKKIFLYDVTIRLKNKGENVFFVEAKRMVLNQKKWPLPVQRMFDPAGGLHCKSLGQPPAGTVPFLLLFPFKLVLEYTQFCYRKEHL